MTKPLSSLASLIVFGCGWLLAGACGSDMQPAPPDTTTHSYTADDLDIQYSGRIDFTNPKQPRYAINGATISARFKGISATVLLKDEYRYAKYVNYYDVVIDGAITMKLNPDTASEDFRYVVATGLPYAEHEVKIIRRTEPTDGNGYFVGFEFEGTILPLAAAPTRRIEFIGDSITAGAGVDGVNNGPECTNSSPDGWGLGVEDAYKTYGSIIAADLNAELHVVGVSGIGLIRNYSTLSDARNMQQVYDLFFPQAMDSPAWDPSKWVPDAIVIGLGTNDYQHGDPTDPTQANRADMDNTVFATAYLDFIHTLQGYYPGVQVFAVSSPLLAEPQATELRTALGLLQTMAADPKVQAINVQKINGAGCTSHPNAAQHMATAAEIEPVVKAALVW